MDEREARRILGVSPGAGPAEIRAAHRRRIRRAHPDAGGSASAAVRVNDALAVLRTVPGGAPAPPATPAGPTVDPVVASDDVDREFVVDASPADLLIRLADAGHEIGEVVFVDPHVGILEIVVGQAPAVGQLAVAVMPGGDLSEGSRVTFTLEPLGVTPAPAIGDVVDALMAALD